jgi:riboflavin kinase/FMN adenylyltransferase
VAESAQTPLAWVAPAEYGTPTPGPLAEGARSILVIGNFDGVHLGHQKLLTTALQLAAARDGRVVAVTFEPHPRALTSPDSTPALLTPLRMRRELLTLYGADLVLVLPFDAHLRELGPGEFLDRLRARHRVVSVVAGPRLSIGRGETGRLDFVTQYTREAGIQLAVIEPVLLDGTEISSSAVRERIDVADLAGAEAMTGRRFTLLGGVEAGDGRGRKLGFPTANLHLHQAQLLPPDGVYVMRLRAGGTDWLPAVGSVGTRPQFGPGERKFEVHCLVPLGDLYGQQVEVEVIQLLRGQEVFASQESLITQMRTDAEMAAARLSLS